VKPYIVVNPKAGSVGDLETLLKQLRRLNPRKLCLTKRTGEAGTLARQAVRAGCDYIIAAGGDGTLNEVINGIAAPHCVRSVRIGMVPLGTANDFARTLNLPASIEENIDNLSANQTISVDLVRITAKRTRYFINVSAGGFSGVVAEKLTSQMKSTWGPLAYLRSAAAALPELHAYHSTIVFDDVEKLMIELYNVIVANGQFVAGGLPVAPDASVWDGLFDVLLVPKRPAGEIVLLAAQMLLGKHLSSGALIFRRAKKLSVTSRPRMSFNVDGERFGNDPAIFEIVPSAVEFVIGKR
jgi:diacylglycerol kinase (ATP)